jgi:hypothetical protein
LLIAFPFFGVRSSGRNQSYDFAAVHAFADSMGDQYQQIAVDHAYRLPAVLAVFKPILVAQLKWVSEHTDGKLKAHTVLRQVSPRFLCIPLELSCHDKYVTTKIPCSVSSMSW